MRRWAQHHRLRGGPQTQHGGSNLLQAHRLFSARHLSTPDRKQHVALCTGGSGAPGKAESSSRPVDSTPSPASRRLSRPKRSGTPSGPDPDGSGPGPSRFGRPSQMQILAGHAAYTGLIGSIAMVGANATHTDLFSMFHWEDTSQLLLALTLILPLQVANLVVLGPDWSDWKLSDIDGEQAQITNSAGSTDTTTAATTGPNAVPVNKSDTASTSPSVNMVPASAWGQQLPSPPGTPQASTPAVTATTLRNALHIAQSNYLMGNPTAKVSPAAEVGVAAVDSLASELLLRGLLITFMASWTRDRLYENGWADMVAVPEPLSSLMQSVAVAATPDSLPLVMSLDDVSRWLALSSLLTALTFLSIRRVAKSARKAQMLRAISERIAVSRRLQKEQRDKAKAAAAAAAAATSQSSNTSDPTTADPSNTADSSLQSQESATSPAGMAGSSLPPRTPRVSSDLTPLAPLSPASPRGGGTGAGNQASLLALAASGAPDTQPSGTWDPVVLASALQSARDLVQGSALSLVFVATGGNLAASFLASFANQIVFSTLQRMGAERSRKRSAALVKEMEAIHERMKAKAAEKLAKTAAHAQALQGIKDTLSNTATTTEPVVASDQPPATPETQASVTAAAAAAAAACSSSPVPELPPPGVSRTLTLLDMLVPEPAASANKANAGSLSGSGSSKRPQAPTSSP